MADPHLVPFLHPALLGVGIGAGLAWAALAPERLRAPLWIVGCAVLAAAVAGIAGWVPWFDHLRLTAYGSLLLTAFLLGWWIARRRACRPGISGTPEAGIPPWFVREQIAIAAIVGIIGARLWFVIEYRGEFPDPRADFPGWLKIAADLDRGGAVWFGGLLLAIAAMALHARRAGVRLLPWADAAAPAVLVGLAIGRIGCFLNGCCYGCPTSLPWGIAHSVGNTVVRVHPTQLYETIACTILAVLVARAAIGRGAASGWALVGYGAWRFGDEMLRGDYSAHFGPGQDFTLRPFHLTSAQWLALPLIALGVWLIARARGPAPAPVQDAPKTAGAVQ